MCGRYILFGPLAAWAQLVGATAPPEFAPRCNIAPTQQVLAVRRAPGDEAAHFALLRWGLIPSWAKDPKIGSRLINARAETIGDKPSFRAAFKHRRCLLPADGFYEWKTVDGRKHPYEFGLVDRTPFALAGLWESWTDAGGGTVETCTIITTAANELLAPFHDRMPVIFDPPACKQWLAAEPGDSGALRSLLRPYAAEKMAAAPASDRLNSSRYEGNDCRD
jgi:putative SOS response-associated peptidase YedK